MAKIPHWQLIKHSIIKTKNVKVAIIWQAQSLAQTQYQSNNADVAMSKILKKNENETNDDARYTLKTFHLWIGLDQQTTEDSCFDLDNFSNTTEDVIWKTWRKHINLSNIVNPDYFSPLNHGCHLQSGQRRERVIQGAQMWSTKELSSSLQLSK